MYIFTFNLLNIMNETCQKAEEFLTDILSDMRFDLSVSSEMSDEGCVLNLSGERCASSADRKRRNARCF